MYIACVSQHLFEYVHVVVHILWTERSGFVVTRVGPLDFGVHLHGANVNPPSRTRNLDKSSVVFARSNIHSWLPAQY